MKNLDTECRNIGWWMQKTFDKHLPLRKIGGMSY